MNSMLNKLTFVRALLCLACLGTACVHSGCATSAGNLALGAAGAGAASVIGSQISTYSKVDVEIEVFNANYAKSGLDLQRFKQSEPLAISRLIGGGGIDPIVQPSKYVFVQVVQKVQPIIDDLSNNQSTLGESIKNIIDTKLPTANKTVLTKIADELRALSTSSAEAISTWAAFKAKFKEVATGDKELDSAQKEILSGLLENFRSSLTSRSEFRFSTPTLDLLRLEIGGVFVRKANDEATDGATKAKIMTAFDRYTESVKGNLNRLGGVAAQLAPYIATAVNTLGASMKPEEAKPVIAEISATIKSFGFSVDLSQAYVTDRPADTEATVRTLIANSQGAIIISKTVRKQDMAYQATFIKLQTDFNIGGIRNEIMQSLLTSDAIPDITSPVNAGRWQKFAHAWSEGHAGNHDAIIYFEHLGLPILKNAGFDPTKFVVANGQMFRKAFGAMTAVFGVPAGTVSTDATSGNTMLSYNLSLAEQSRQANQKFVDDTQTQIVTAVSALVKAGEADIALPADDMDKKKALRDKLSKDLQDAIDALKKAEMKPADSK